MGNYFLLGYILREKRKKKKKKKKEKRKRKKNTVPESVHCYSIKKRDNIINKNN